jgi:hypothetical protein
MPRKRNRRECLLAPSSFVMRTRALRVSVPASIGTVGLRGFLWIVAGLLGACGYFGGSHPAASAHSPPKAQASQQSVDPAAKVLAGMVEAVGPSGAQAPLEFKFSIRDRPQVGQDDEIDYALVPQVAGIDTLRVVFGSIDGLDVVSQGPALAAIKPAPGVPIFGSVTVRPLKTGLFTLMAAVGVGSSSQSLVWTFRIPVIAGDGPAQTAANRP